MRPIRGCLAMCWRARDQGRTFVLPRASAGEAALLPDTPVLGAGSLLEVCAFLHGKGELEPPTAPDETPERAPADLADVKGQSQARRALEVAAAGRHNLLLIGPPGTGKSMLAQRLPGILPRMTVDEGLETAAIHSLSGLGFQPRGTRPFRPVHHSASPISLVGGGSNPKPGEISLAHNGVLFLDELPEFDRKVLEMLREPLETRRITISRAARQAEYPANFQLISAMNPCPCGYHGASDRHCRCTPEQVRRYRGRLSGPLLDRVDLAIEVPALSQDDLMRAGAGEDSASVRQRVENAFERQRRRQGCSNAELQGRELEEVSAPDAAAAALLMQAIQRLKLSARAHHRVLKVARTVADLDGSEAVTARHVAEAIQYRRALEAN